MITLRNRQAGFTIIELLIATAVFATVLLLCTMGLLQVGRMYYKGITMTRTQETARTIMDEIAQGIQFSGGSVLQDTTTSKICIGNKRFSYLLDTVLTNSPTAGDESYHVLVVDSQESNCVTADAQDINQTTLTSSSKELLAPKMRLNKLLIDPKGSGLYEITVRVIYGETDLLESDHSTCKSGSRGSQFCAFAELKTTVKKRLNVE